MNKIGRVTERALSTAFQGFLSPAGGNLIFVAAERAIAVMGSTITMRERCIRAWWCSAILLRFEAILRRMVTWERWRRFSCRAIAAHCITVLAQSSSYATLTASRLVCTKAIDRAFTITTSRILFLFRFDMHNLER